MIRAALLALVVLLAPVTAAQEAPTPAERWQDYRVAAFGTTTLVLIPVFAAYDHVLNEPPEWSSSVQGFGTRVLSYGGRLVIDASVVHGSAALLGLDVRAPVLPEGTRLRRASYAALGALTARLPSGQRIPSVPLLLGATSGAMAQSAWEPGGLDWREVGISTTIAVGLTVAGDFVVGLLQQPTPPR
ncbi:MAG: hypothetical protein AAF809_08985 [Bacteroidota bacterium]